jgi:hypothetical protein
MIDDGIQVVHGYDGSKDYLYSLKSELGKYKLTPLPKQGTLS